jgi:hypothetical protein
LSPDVSTKVLGLYCAAFLLAYATTARPSSAPEPKATSYDQMLWMGLKKKAAYLSG